MADVYIPLCAIVKALEIPFFVVLMILGIVAYFKTKNRAIKYAIILFPVVMVLDILVSLIISTFHLSYTETVRVLHLIPTFITFVVCLIIFILGVRWYIRNKDTILLCLVISFGMYALSGLLILLYDYILRYYDCSEIVITAVITGIATYLLGISAMIVALVQHKRRLAIA